MARFPAWLMPADEGWCLTFPDVPGCLAAGASAEAVVQQAEEALAFHLEGMMALNRPVPQPSSLSGLPSPVVPGAVLMLVTARPPKAPAVRVNITLDKNLLAEIDAQAAGGGFTRSGFLAEAARRFLQED
jgi:predicted RNase H-like HicB family nuclease